MDKPKLPKGWIVVKSKNYPSRVYYFNKKTHEKSWDCPEGAAKDESSEDETAEQQPGSPPASSSSEIKNRPKLRARRRLSTSSASSTTTEAPNTSKDTPQMILLRQKLAERKAKGNAVKKSLIPAEIEAGETKANRDPRRRDPKITPVQNSSRQSLTPQARLIREKIDAKKAADPKNKSERTKEISPKETERILPDSNSGDGQRVTRLRSKSMGGALKTPEKSSKLATSTPEARQFSSARKSLLKTIQNEEREEKSPKIPRIAEKRSAPASGKKNIAQERMKRLRMSLNEKNSEKTGDLEDPVGINNIEKTLSTPAPSIERNAISRSKRIAQNNHNEARVKFQLKQATQTTFEDPEDTVPTSSDLIIKELIDSPKMSCEDMDWEPVQDEEIITEIEVVRTELGVEDIDMQREKSIENSLDLTDGPSKSTNKKLYIVIDTNVFLSNLPIITQVRDTEFRNYGKPIIVVPWTVLRELDYIKDDKNNSRSESLKFNARQAVNFLHKHFSTRHPRVLGQTPRDVANNRDKFASDCPDDEILQTCLQIRESNNPVVLLSYDKNLCNKAMIHDMTTIGRNEPLEKIDYLNIFDNYNSESLLSTSLSGNNNSYEPRMTAVEKEALLSAEIYDEIKDILTEFLTIIVTTEMKNKYRSDRWETFVEIRPPWTVETVLICAMKHWLSTVGESFKSPNANAENIIKELYDIVKKLMFNKINDVEYFIDLVWRLMQSLDKTKYPNFLINITSKMDELRGKCREAMKEINLQYLKDQIGYKDFEEKADERANLAFRYFEKVYEYARDICGAACEIMNIKCSILYQKLERGLSADEIRYLQPDVAGRIIQLLYILGIALEDVNGLNPAHNSVKSLYETLESFYSIAFEDRDDCLSPLDVYCCLTRKEKVLKAGIKQLSDLSLEFARIASYKYK